MTSNVYSLGLDDRDRLGHELGGGIPEGSIVLLEGEYGAGKSAMSQRFTYGLCEEGNTVTYLSTEIETSDFVQQMHSIGYNVERHMLDERLLFLYADLDTGRRLAGEGTGERKQLLNRLMEAEVMWQADLVIIDTFDTLLRKDPKFEALIRQNEERQAALEIISFLRDVVSGGRTVILTVDPSTVDQEAIGPFRSIADVYLELQMIEVGNEVRRQLNVKRFAGVGEVVGETVGYSVRADTGIVIESRSVA